MIFKKESLKLKNVPKHQKEKIKAIIFDFKEDIQNYINEKGKLVDTATFYSGCALLALELIHNIKDLHDGGFEMILSQIEEMKDTTH